MARSDAAVVIVDSDGRITAQNRASRRWIGPQCGRLCWEVMHALQEEGSLPCLEGCSGQLIAAGIDNPIEGRLVREGLGHQLRCIPVDDHVVCALIPAEGGDVCRSKKTLTAREWTVLELIAAGETTTSAARQLGLSVATVRTHVEKLRLKLEAGTQAALVARGYELGYLPRRSDSDAN